MDARTLALAVALIIPVPLTAQDATIPTEVRVHVVSRDAKLVGTAVGGVWITIRDAASGRTLAEGLHTGGTGDTRRIMQTPRVRDTALFNTEGAAHFTATIPLSQPTVVVITAHGPMGFPDQAVTSSKQMLLVPGEHLRGDGVVLELQGLIVEILEPAPTTASDGGAVRVRARVRMLCSCPTGPDQLWSAGTVRARLVQDGKVLLDATLPSTGEASMYAGSLVVPGPGFYTLEVLASDPMRGNAGVARRDLRVP